MAGHAATNGEPGFPRTIDGLDAVGRTGTVRLEDGDRYDLRITPVLKEIAGSPLRMLAYNGCIPGPTIRVPQGSRISVDVVNEGDLETTVHWHGLRLENRFDGVPHDTQAPIAVGGKYVHHLVFPDPGLYWYHPHLREDYAKELGLYGTIVVEAADPAYWPAVNRDVVVTLDDILLIDGDVAPFSHAGPDHTAMGRFGNVMLVNGEESIGLAADIGEIVRFYLVNAANTRTFDVRVPGGIMKLVGADNGHCEHETFVDSVLLAPSERAVVDVCFNEPGSTAIQHVTPNDTYELGRVTVGPGTAAVDLRPEHERLRVNADLVEERSHVAVDLLRPPDKALAFIGEMPGMTHHDMGHGEHETRHDDDGIEWEDTMPAMNRMSTPANMLWKIVDRESGAVNHEIDWTFALRDRVKIRLENVPDSDHPMQHPFHVHGERFVVIARDGVPNPNLVWKDTVLVRTGETVDIVLEASNPGLWMAHCHIAEHAESGMMFNFRVIDTRRAPATARA